MLFIAKRRRKKKGGEEREGRKKKIKRKKFLFIRSKHAKRWCRRRGAIEVSSLFVAATERDCGVGEMGRGRGRRIWSIHLSGENATTANNAVVFSRHALCRQVRQSRALKFDRYSVGRSFWSPPPHPSITRPARKKKRARFVVRPATSGSRISYEWHVFQNG